MWGKGTEDLSPFNIINSKDIFRHIIYKSMHQETPLLISGHAGFCNFTCILKKRQKTKKALALFRNKFYWEHFEKKKKSQKATIPETIKLGGRP